MRVVAGSLRGRPLKGFKGSLIRPTSDRVKEAIFNVLSSRGFFSSSPHVLDLYAGTGALGIEALSRAAAEVVFVDSSHMAVRLIRKNTDKLGVLDKAVIIHDESVRAIKGLVRRGALFDIIFMDPPYDSALIESTLGAAAPVLAPGGLIVAEAPKGLVVEAGRSGFTELDRRVYGDTSVFYFEKDEGRDEGDA